MKRIKINEEYFVKVKTDKKPTNNYPHFIDLYRVGEKMPLVGQFMHERSTRTDFINWGVAEVDKRTDLFEHPENLPAPVQNLISKEVSGYKACEQLLAKLKPLGYTFEYGLDGQPYNLQKLPNHA